MVQISKRSLDPKLDKKFKQTLSQVIADLNSKEKADLFLKDFLTDTEYIALSKRLAIITYLAKGHSYKDIKREIKVSSATIATVQNQLENKESGIHLALKFIKAEEWASKWTGKLSGIFGKK